LDPTLRPGIRKALEPHRAPGGSLLARRRNLRQNQGTLAYRYRAADKERKTVDFLLRAKRDVAAAKAFFRRAFGRQGGLPDKISLNGYQASHRAAKEALGNIPMEINARSGPQDI
jgi:transposase-like protein